MHFLGKKISFVIFEYGGLALVFYFIVALKKRRNIIASINVGKLRFSLQILIFFIFATSAAYHDFFAILYGQPSIQFINNLLAGIFFLLFLATLWKSISFHE